MPGGRIIWFPHMAYTHGDFPKQRHSVLVKKCGLVYHNHRIDFLYITFYGRKGTDILVPSEIHFIMERAVSTMTQLETMQRAKQYLDKLSRGIDPITDTPLEREDPLAAARLQKCFEYVSGILG